MANTLSVHFADVQGVQTRYLQTGNGPPLMLLHPVGFSADIWIRNMAELGSRWTVIAPDLPNHGFSDLVDYEGVLPQAYFAQHALLLARTLHIEKMAVAGSSLGGHVASLMYFQAPGFIERLIIIGSGTSFSSEEELARSLPNTYANAMKAITNPTWDGCVARMRNLCHRMDDEPRELILGQLTSYARPGFRAAYDATLKGMMDLDRARPFRILERLDELRVPTQIIWGRQDPRSDVANAIAASSQIPGCSLSIFEECGHLPYFEHPHQFNESVASFLSASL
jgi:2-hydroxy-6-oxonona-2,4-dienedioate hydrolase